MSAHRSIPLSGEDMEWLLTEMRIESGLIRREDVADDEFCLSCSVHGDVHEVCALRFSSNERAHGALAVMRSYQGHADTECEWSVKPGSREG